MMVGSRCKHDIVAPKKPYKTGCAENKHIAHQQHHNKRAKTPLWTEPSTNAFPQPRPAAYLPLRCLRYTYFG